MKQETFVPYHNTFMNRKNILACRPSSYGSYANGAFSHLRQIGVKYVEIPVPNSSEVKMRLADLESYGLRASSLEGKFDLRERNCVGELKSQLAVAVQMGAKIVFLSVQRGDLAQSAAFSRLREAGEMAALYGVTLALETHPDLITNAEVALETMRGVNHPNVRVNFDTANIYYYNEGVDGLAELMKLLEYVGAVHLKDTNGGFRTWHFPALGEGIVNFREVFRLLNEREFYGPFTLEIEGIRGETLSREQTESRVAKSVDYLRSLGCVD